jgi:hypothetical protein
MKRYKQQNQEPIDRINKIYRIQSRNKNEIGAIFVLGLILLIM